MVTDGKNQLVPQLRRLPAGFGEQCTDRSDAVQKPSGWFFAQAKLSRRVAGLNPGSGSICIRNSIKGHLPHVNRIDVNCELHQLSRVLGEP